MVAGKALIGGVDELLAVEHPALYQVDIVQEVAAHVHIARNVVAHVADGVGGEPARLRRGLVAGVVAQFHLQQRRVAHGGGVGKVEHIVLGEAVVALAAKQGGDALRLLLQALFRNGIPDLEGVVGRVFLVNLPYGAVGNGICYLLHRILLAQGHYVFDGGLVVLADHRGIDSGIVVSLILQMAQHTVAAGGYQLVVEQHRLCEQPAQAHILVGLFALLEIGGQFAFRIGAGVGDDYLVLAQQIFVLGKDIRLSAGTGQQSGQRQEQQGVCKFKPIHTQYITQM